MLRCDLNLPADTQGNLLDDWRLHCTLPTLKTLLERGARVGLLTHFGRPGGRPVPRFSTRVLAQEMSKLLGDTIEFVPDCVGRTADYAMETLPPGKAVMLENLRFHPGEMLNQMPFVVELAKLGDVYINDAFAAAHRPHASTTGLTAMIKEHAIGPLMQQEIAWAQKALFPHNEGSVVVILAGSQVAPKLELMRHLLTQVDTIVLGGAVANTFLAARDLGLGHSLLDPTLVAAARDLMAEAGVLGCRLHLPQDVMVAELGAPGMLTGVKSVQNLEPNDVANDIGPQTIATWRRLLEDAGSIIWFGGLGLMEYPDFAAGSMQVAAKLSQTPTFSLVAGDGLIRMLGMAGFRHKMPALSSGAAALMALLKDHDLPALAAMRQAQARAA